MTLVAVNCQEKVSYKGSTRAQQRLTATAYLTPIWVGKATLPEGRNGQEKPALPTSAQPWDEILTARKHPLAAAELGFPSPPGLPDTTAPRARCCARRLRESSREQISSLAAEFTNEVYSYFSSRRNTPLHLRISCEIEAYQGMQNLGRVECLSMSL